tara:strand:+ start:3840 stop:5327 length:1488 start_codon:yes stop_codon:yes gene_type:complete
MSHLIKKNKKIKKIINLFLYTFLIFTIALSTINYDGNKFIIFTYAILINLIFINAFKKNSYFFEFFFGILLWLGFWIKLIFIINYYSYAFFEGAGSTYENVSLEKRLIEIDQALIVSILAFISYLSACLLKDFFFKKKIICDIDYLNLNKSKTFIIIQDILIACFVIVVFFTSYFNIEHLIYQRGLKSQSEFNFIINGVIKWVLLFGFSSFVCFFIFINLKNKKKIYQMSLISILETFVSSLSYLSRGMIFNSLSIVYGLYKSNKFYNLQLKFKFFLIYFITIFIFFFISVSSINYLRHNYFFYNIVDNEKKLKIFDKKDKIIVEKQYDTFNKAFTEFYFLAINRWVGIDAVLSASSKKDKNWNTLVDSFKEKYDTTKLPYYERIIQLRETKVDHQQLNYGITTPGIISFLFYSGSKIFLIFSFFILSFFMLLFEKFILNKTTNLILCALIMQQVAYRLAHFGYMPLNSYMFFGTIILTVLIHQLLLYLFKKIDL